MCGATRTELRIHSLLVPREVWMNGPPQGAAGVPPASRTPLNITALDASAIELRTLSRVNLRQEHRRYRLCVQRMQGIARDLERAGLASCGATFGPEAPSAWALLATFGTTWRWAARKLTVPALDRAVAFRCRHLASGFCAPDEVGATIEALRCVVTHPKVDGLYRRASRDAPSNEIALAPEDCRQAVLARLDLLEGAADEGQGVVDVFL